MKLRELKQLLKEFKFKEIFIGLNYSATTRPEFTQVVGPTTFKVRPIAELGGLFVLEATVPGSDKVPPRDKCAALDKAISGLYTENLLIFVNEARTDSYFQRAVTVKDKRQARGHRYMKGAPAEPLARTLLRLEIPFQVFDDEGQVAITEVTDRLDQSGLFAEKVTKKFFKEFSDLRKGMLKFLGWIQDESKREWYCSVLLNRLMFIYFIAEKGFLPGGKAFLRNQLEANRKGENGKNTFYTHYLLPLSFFGLGERQGNRGRFEPMFKDVLYLNGGLFAVHSIERELGIDKQAVEDAKFDPFVSIEDQEFVRWFDYFDKWRWTLDEDQVEHEGYISPHILGYIFEKYINQKQMGAYYTKEDITGYICRNTIIPRLFDMLAEASDKGKRAVHALPIGPHPNLLNDGKGISQGEGIERYIYPAVKTTEYLPTETDYEYNLRQARYGSILQDFDAGQIESIEDFITYNLNIEQLALDFVENIQDPDVLHDFYFKGLQRISVLDPTCGSGAFLFAALNILYPLYEASLKRMRYLVGKATGKEPDVVNWRGELHFDDLLGSQGVLTDQVEASVLEQMRAEVERINDHPTAEYFIRKSIIVNNLFGVDIMEEAVEICKLRLFLTLIATAERDTRKSNQGVEPLPDIDFNILPGNTLVGYTSVAAIDEMWRAVELHSSTLAFEKDHTKLIDLCREYSRLLTAWRQQQLLERGGQPIPKDRVLAAAELVRPELNEDIWRLFRTAGLATHTEGTKRRELTQREFLEQTHPFHWLLEFPFIEAAEGFDVIVGNPPFLETKQVDYEVEPLKLKDSAAIHAMCCEVSLQLLKKSGWMSMVMPMSIVSTQRMKVLQEMIEDGRCAWYSNYSWRPSKLFDAVNRAITIFVAGPARELGTWSTQYIRWSAEARDTVVSSMNYTAVDRKRRHFWVPKLATNGEREILTRLLAQPKKLGTFIGKGTGRVYYRIGGGLYWKVFTTFAPEFTVNGRKEPSSRETSFLVRDEHLAHAVVALLSSNLFWWWYTVASNLRDLNPVDIHEFPLPEAVLADPTLQDLGRKYEADISKNSLMRTRVQKQTGVTATQSFRIALSKGLIDQIDDELAKHYGFSEDQVSYLKSYDEKYRMSSVGGDDE